MEPDTPELSSFIKEDDFQELLALVRTLRLVNGITILFAQCDDAKYRNKLIEQTRQLYGDRIAEVRIPQGTYHLLEYLVEIVPEYAAAIFVVGIEDWLSSGTVGETSRFVATLNSTRDHFPKLIHRPIVFWAPSHILTTLFRGAPDFFSTISGIFTFSAGEEKQIPQPHVPIPDREAERRETELMALLAEHDSLPEDRQDETTRAVLLLGIGKARRDAGRYDDAEVPIMESLRITEKQFGFNHPETVALINELAGIYLLLGKYMEAESLFIRSLDISEKVFGANHPNTATSLNNLGLLYETQGRYIEAEPLHIRALGIRELVLGPDHPSTATSLNNLALLYESQGKYIDAEPLHIRALKIKENALGIEHEDTVTSMNNLAVLYQAQGRYTEAERLYIRTLEIREKAMGADHPNTAISLNNLAALYRAQNKFSEAEKLYVRALNIKKKVLGENHPSTTLS